MAPEVYPEKSADDRPKDSYPQFKELIIKAQDAVNRVRSDKADEAACLILGNLNERLKGIYGRQVAMTGPTYYPQDDSSKGDLSKAFSPQYHEKLTSTGRFAGLRVLSKQDHDGQQSGSYTFFYAVNTETIGYRNDLLEHKTSLFHLSPVGDATLIDISHHAPPDEEMLGWVAGRQLEELDRICEQTRRGNGAAFHKLSRLVKEELDDMPANLQLEVVRFLNGRMLLNPNLPYELFGPKIGWILESVDSSGQISSLGRLDTPADAMLVYLKEFIQLPKLTQHAGGFSVDADRWVIAMRAEVLTSTDKRLQECYFLCGDVEMVRPVLKPVLYLPTVGNF